MISLAQGPKNIAPKLTASPAGDPATTQSLRIPVDIVGFSVIYRHSPPERSEGETLVFTTDIPLKRHLKEMDRTMLKKQSMNSLIKRLPWLIGGFGFAIVLILGQVNSLQAAEPKQPQPGQRHLFFDDLEIEKKQNLKRVVNQPTKHPDNPVLRREHPWEEFRIQVYGTMIFDPDEKIFKSWYMNIPKTAKQKITVAGQRRPGHATLLSYATSKDGVKWHKPILDLIDFEGSKKNNMIAPELYNPEGFSVLHEPHDPNPKRRYKAFYWDHGMGPLIMHKGEEIYGSGPKDGMHVAFSPDGVHWKSYENNPVMKLGSDTGQVVLYDEEIKRYVAYGRFGAGGRKVARSESTDFIHWSKPRLVLKPDKKDGPKTQFYGITINRYAGQYVGVLWMFWIEAGNVGRIDFQLCHSRDGKTWIRDPERNVFLPNGPPGSWDAFDMRAACHSVILDDRILFYYAGSAAPHGKGAEMNLGMDIGLATLRRDGWVSLNAGEKPGILTTKPFPLPKEKLHLNVDADGGQVQIALIDSTGKIAAQSKTITGDQLDVPVLFPKTKLQPGTSVQLKITAEKAKLYSYWFDAK